MRLVFAGTPEFAAVALQRLLQAGFDVPLVLTQPDRPAGRGLKLQPSPVKLLALDHGLQVAQPLSLRLDGKHPQDAAAAKWLLEDLKPDALVVAAYGLILPSLLIICLLELYPIAYSMWLTTQDVQLDVRGLDAVFVGADNWRHMLRDRALPEIAVTTMHFTGLVVVATLLLGLGIALLLNQEFRGQRFCRLMLLVPWAIPTVVSARIGFGVTSPVSRSFEYSTRRTTIFVPSSTSPLS